MLVLEENETSSPVALKVELTLGRAVTLNRSTAIAPTMSKTVKIKVNRTECFFLPLKLALRFFKQSR